MQTEERILIESLFDRIQQTALQSEPHNPEAEKLIQQKIKQQPDSPYYMTQIILIQEAAIENFDKKIKELEHRLTQIQEPPSNKQTRFLSGLSGFFGRGDNGISRVPTERSGGTPASANMSQPPSPGNTASTNMPQAPSPSNNASLSNASTSFLGGALKTAAGIAGGVMLADMLTGAFRHSQPKEIVDTVENTTNVTEESYSNTAMDNSSLLQPSHESQIEDSSFEMHRASNTYSDDNNFYSDYDDGIDDSDFT